MGTHRRFHFHKLELHNTNTGLGSTIYEQLIAQFTAAAIDQMEELFVINLAIALFQIELHCLSLKYASIS